jgi:hypothetical protein
MASVTVVKNMKVTPFPSDGFSEKKVSFCEQIIDNEQVIQLTKTWDGQSSVSLLYSELIYDFIYADQSVPLTTRTNKMKERLCMIPDINRTTLLKKFMDEVEFTVEQLEDPVEKNVPLWSKGGGGKKGSYSFPASTRDTSLQWVRLFIGSLKKM